MADKNYLVGGIGTGTNFEIGAKAPIDSRFKVLNATGLNELLTYEGLISYNEADKTYYQFVDGGWKPLAVKSAEELAAFVTNLIATTATGAMNFKGVAATLPENPAKGDMWKVAGENINIVIDEKAAKVGDTIIYNGEAWTLIPSGDDIEDTWRKVIAGGNELGNDETLELIAGENVTITEDGGKVTISSSYEDTHYESKLVVGNEATDANDENVVENGNVHLNLVEDDVVKSSHKIVGAGGITVTHATGEDGNIITIEAPEGAKYDLAAKTENDEAVLSLAGTDNTEDKVAIIGNDAVSVTVNEAGKVVISAHDTTYEGSTGDEITVTVEDGVVSAALVEVGLDKLAEAIQTKLGYVDTGKNITTAIAEAINALSAEDGAIYNIVKDGGTIDVKIGNAIAALNLDTTYVKEEGFNDRVTAIKVTNAGHADTAANATNAGHATEADHATNADNATNAGHANTAGSADEAAHATNADNADNATEAAHAVSADNATEAGHAVNADNASEAAHATNADNATHAVAAGKVDNAITVKVGGADVVFDGSEAKTADVDAAIKAAVDAIPPQTDYTVTCTDEDIAATDSTPAFKRHTLNQNGKPVCTIDVPRDLVVKSGYVDKDKNELVLVLVNDAEIRVDVSHLIEYVTGGTAADGIITVNVDDNFVATATINDGTITEAKLTSEVQTKLNKQWATTEQGAVADTALQEVTIAGKKLTKAGQTEVTADEIATALDLANKYATTTQGAKADTALQEITTTKDNGLKVSTKADGKQNIDIDTDVVFVLNCNY